MDQACLNVLDAEVRAQLAAIAEVATTIEERAARLQADDPAFLESLAYQMHNLYNAVEDLFRIVASAFENNVTDPGRWHSELLRRMTLEIEGMRPALVSKELHPLLNELRGFRHFFRHGYAATLEETRLGLVLERAREAGPLLERDVLEFLSRLRDVEDPASPDRPKIA